MYHNRVKLSTFKANSDINKFAAAAQKNADSLIPDVERIKPYLKQLAERLGGPPAAATAPPTPSTSSSRPPTAPTASPAVAAVVPQPSAPVVVAPKEKPQPKYLTPVVIQAPAKVPAKVVTPVVAAPPPTPVTSPPAKTASVVAAKTAPAPGQPLNVDDDEDGNIPSSPALASSTSVLSIDGWYGHHRFIINDTCGCITKGSNRGGDQRA
jgi:hypothetical protein